MESWFASLKNEELYPAGQPATRAEARARLFDYIWDYNHYRRHSTLGYVAPIIYATVPAALHNTGQCENNRIECDHGRLKARLGRCAG